MRLIDFFDRRVSMHPDRRFLIDGDVETTYSQSCAVTHQVANVLIELGCTVGTKVAVFSPNIVRAFECMLGLLRAGCAWVPLNVSNGLEENTHILRSFQVDVLLYHSSLAEKVQAYCVHVPGIRHVLQIDGEGPGTLQQMMGQAGKFAPADRGLGPDAVATLFPSGGTTGLSKAAVWTNSTWQAMVANFYAAFPVRRDPVDLGAAPMTHAAGGVALLLMVAGATVVVLPGFSAERVADAIERHAVTHLFLPPTAIYMMLASEQARSRNYSSLDYFIYAAAPMSVDKLREAIDTFGPVMAQTYGQAEAPMLCTALTPRDHIEALGVLPQRLASCGRPALLSDVAIMDDDGNRLKAGDVGEIVVRGPLVMQGYFANARATEEASRFGWHHTSDLGYMDSDGFVYIVDRKRDMIISGGFNVFPSEVEQVIWGHQGVQDCCVIGVPDEKWGERVKAFIQPKPGQMIDIAVLAALCRQKLGAIKTPKEFEIRTELPRSAVGKVLKRVLRDEAWKNAGRRI